LFSIFVSIIFGIPRLGKIKIVLTPQPEIAKSNWRNIHRFEITHGEIKDSEQPAIPLNFGPQDKHS
jgi:hypothetical protein